MTADKQYTILRDSLLQPCIFYIPKKGMNTMGQELLVKNEALNSILDTIIYINKNLEFGSFDFKIDQVDIINKPELLYKNILILLELKEHYSKALFSVIIKKYIDIVSGYSVASRYLSDNFMLVFGTTKFKKIDNYFLIQADAFQLHLKQLNTHFSNGIDKHPIQQNEAIHYITKEFPNIPLNINKGIQKTNKSKEKSKKKQPPITPQEAREFILKTVFNVSKTNHS